MERSVNDTYLADIRRTFRNYRRMTEAAIAQVSDAQLFEASGADDNSIAIVMQHVAGNLRSRFRDFLTTDGEKPDRDRDAEFEAPPVHTREALLASWNEAWTIVLDELDRLTAADLERVITIRQEPFAVVEALNRSATHTAYHVGQVVWVAKHFAGAAWTSLSIPKGQSREHAVGTFKQGMAPRA